MNGGTDNQEMHLSPRAYLGRWLPFRSDRVISIVRLVEKISMVNPYETPVVQWSESQDRDGSRRSHVLPLFLWGVIPICLSVRRLWDAVNYLNLNGVGASFPSVILHGIVEYVLLATWLLAVSTRYTKSPAVRVMRAFAFLPASYICVYAACSIVKHLLPGGGFYVPTVLAHGGLGEFLVLHLLYAVTFVPLFAYTFVMFHDGYEAFKLIGGQTLFATQSTQTNHALDRSDA